MIDQVMFMHAFARDVDFHDSFRQSSYLDLKTGDIIWVYEDDEDAYMELGIPADENRATKERIETAPNWYIEIPGLDHGDHHEILQEFLNSDWTEDERLLNEVRSAYTGSIGGWKTSVEDEAVIHAYHDFFDRKTTEMAEEFLLENGVDLVWK
jgi:hypothetical protein